MKKIKRVIIELEFENLVHFGTHSVGISLEKSSFTAGSNTIYSALVIEFIRLFGEGKLEDFIKNFKQNIRISNLLPYNKEDETSTYYIPKPKKILTKKNIDRDKEKEIKKIKYIPINEIENYLDCEYNENTIFAKEVLIDKNKTRRSNTNEENELYTVSGYKFYGGKGLYFILEYKEDKDIEVIKTLINSLQYTGIGGKKSTGYGRFTYSIIEKVPEEFEKPKENNGVILLSNLLLTKKNANEISNGYYSIIKYNGYSNFRNNTNFRKKDTYLIEEGSCFEKEIEGEIIDVGYESAPSYLYGLGIYITIKEKGEVNGN